MARRRRKKPWKGHRDRRIAEQNKLGDGGRGQGPVRQFEPLADPWQCLFDRAVVDRPAEANDLVPFWVCEPGDAGEPAFKIERKLPLLPFSREVGRIEQLKRSLVAYRSVIGQPRQQELLDFLMQHLDPDEIEALVLEATIDLSPLGQ